MKSEKLPFRLLLVPGLYIFQGNEINETLDFITNMTTKQRRKIITTETMLVLTMEYQILLSILSTSWLTPPPLCGLSVVVGFGVVFPTGVVLEGIGGIVGSDIIGGSGVGGLGFGGRGPGSGIVLLAPVIKQ